MCAFAVLLEVKIDSYYTPLTPFVFANRHVTYIQSERKVGRRREPNEVAILASLFAFLGEKDRKILRHPDIQICVSKTNYILPAVSCVDLLEFVRV